MTVSINSRLVIWLNNVKRRFGSSSRIRIMKGAVAVRLRRRHRHRVLVLCRRSRRVRVHAAVLVTIRQTVLLVMRRVMVAVEARRHAATVVGTRCALVIVMDIMVMVVVAFHLKVGRIRVSHLHLSIHFIIVIAFEKKVRISGEDAAVESERRVHTLYGLRHAKECLPS